MSNKSTRRYESNNLKAVQNGNTADDQHTMVLYSQTSTEDEGGTDLEIFDSQKMINKDSQDSQDSQTSFEDYGGPEDRDRSNVFNSFSKFPDEYVPPQKINTEDNQYINWEDNNQFKNKNHLQECVLTHKTLNRKSQGNQHSKMGARADSPWNQEFILTPTQLNKKSEGNGQSQMGANADSPRNQGVVSPRKHENPRSQEMFTHPASSHKYPHEKHASFKTVLLPERIHLASRAYTSPRGNHVNSSRRRQQQPSQSRTISALCSPRNLNNNRSHSRTRPLFSPRSNKRSLNGN